jgi:hypothetical protein
MPFSSQDDLISELSSGKYVRRDSSKIMQTAHTAGGWHQMFTAGGYPNASTFPSAQDLVFQSCTDVGGDAAAATLLGIQHGGNVSTDTKHILNIGASVLNATGAPWQLKLVDLQGYYRMATTNVTGTGSRTLINSNTITASSSSGLLLTYTNDFNNYTKVRFVNSGGALPTGLVAGTDYWLVRLSATTARPATSLANAIAGTTMAFTDAGSGTNTMWAQTPRYSGGVGCQAFFTVQTQPTAGGPTLSASAYDVSPGTGSPGTGSRTFQGTPTMGATADAYAGRVLHSGNAAGRFGPFLPLQGGDTGVARVNSFTWSGGTAYTGSGVTALCIVRPLADIAIPVSGMWSERDLVNQLPSLPQIEDGACLGWMLFSTAATPASSPLTTAIDFGWG